MAKESNIPTVLNRLAQDLAERDEISVEEALRRLEKAIGDPVEPLERYGP